MSDFMGPSGAGVGAGSPNPSLRGFVGAVAPPPGLSPATAIVPVPLPAGTVHRGGLSPGFGGGGGGSLAGSSITGVPVGGVGATGIMDEGGEWEREGLGRGLEERLDWVR